MKHLYHKCFVFHCASTNAFVKATTYNAWNHCRTRSWRNYGEYHKKKKVLVSLSNNVYYNLALEDWLYKNSNFAKEPLLLLWRNEPCIVIGRHQNPWVECNLPFMKKRNIMLARRNSGGGTVYHDMGNLNCTFFTERKDYNRKANLQTIVDALMQKWGFDLKITSREDICLEENYKISGTAAKLGNPNAYHHCTILFNVNKNNLARSLEKNVDRMDSKATASVVSAVKNLKDVNAQIDFLPLVETISSAYLANAQDGKCWTEIKPNETSFPGIDKIQSHLISWKWIYGHTPRFLISRRFAIPRSIFIHRAMDREIPGKIERVDKVPTERFQEQAQPFTIEVGMEVYHAKIEKLTISPSAFLPQEILSSLTEMLIGHFFNPEEATKTLDDLMDKSKADARFFNKLKFVSKCLCTLIKDC